MSRIGRLPIAVPAGVTVTITDDNTGMCERFVMYALPDADKVKETLKPFLPL